MTSLNSSPVLERFKQSSTECKEIPIENEPVNIEKSIKDNLEKLLNTRSMFINNQTELKQLNDSCISYGMIDLLELNKNAKIRQQDVCNIVKAAIEKHEKRLMNISVELATGLFSSSIINLSISAELVNNSKQAVIFETSLETNKQRFSVAKGIYI